MNPVYWAAGLAAAAVFLYLVLALFNAEDL